jgi:hypothetical protein
MRAVRSVTAPSAVSSCVARELWKELERRITRGRRKATTVPSGAALSSRRAVARGRNDKCRGTGRAGIEDRQRRPERRRSAGRSDRAASRTRFLVHALVETRDLGHPAPPIRVFERENRLRFPVEVVGNERYLLEESIEGVATNPPRPSTSTWTSCSHSGQTTCRRSGSTALTRL